MTDKIIFVSDLCPDCTSTIKDYQDNPEKYADAKVINITASMANLKAYLHYRDSLEDFDEIKAAGKVGIPCLIENGSLKLL